MVMFRVTRKEAPCGAPRRAWCQRRLRALSFELADVFVPTEALVRGDFAAGGVTRATAGHVHHTVGCEADVGSILFRDDLKDLFASGHCDLLVGLGGFAALGAGRRTWATETVREASLATRAVTRLRLLFCLLAKLTTRAVPVVVCSALFPSHVSAVVHMTIIHEGDEEWEVL